MLNAQIVHWVGQRLLLRIWHGWILALLRSYGDEDLGLWNLLSRAVALRHLVWLYGLLLRQVLGPTRAPSVGRDEPLGLVDHRWRHRLQHLLLILILTRWLGMLDPRVLLGLAWVLLVAWSLILLILLATGATLIRALLRIASLVLRVLLVVVLLRLSNAWLLQILLVVWRRLLALRLGLLGRLADSRRVRWKYTRVIAIRSQILGLLTILSIHLLSKLCSKIRMPIGRAHLITIFFLVHHE
jgi:hypothetical protein